MGNNRAKKTMRTFNYQGLTFEPLRKQTKAQKKWTLRQWSQHLQSDIEHHASLSRYGGTYTYYGFYATYLAVCGEESADFFLCHDNGKTYIPGDNELFIYNN